MTSVIPSGRSHTTGCPVQPLPHHTLGSFPTGDWPHIGLSGNRQAIVGVRSGTGPVP